MTFSESLGSIGVSILLLAFVLNLLKVLKTESLLYTVLNFFGAGIACYASYLIPYFPFVVLEGVWTIFSFVALIRWLRSTAKGGGY
jgi:hypothetical protein